MFWDSFHFFSGQKRGLSESRKARKTLKTQKEEVCYVFFLILTEHVVVRKLAPTYNRCKKIELLSKSVIEAINISGSIELIVVNKTLM